MSDAPRDLPAGDFAEWLARTREVLAGRAEADVPCGGCTACCETSHFVHVEPDERAALAAFPVALHAPAPGRPRGHVVIGYDAHGRCPMLGEGTCTIHARRPRACRRYDCRVFAAAGIDADRDAISARARRWVFAYATPAAHERHAAVRAAARFLVERAACFPGGGAPRDPAAIAVAAIETHDVFVTGAGRGWDPTTSTRERDEAIASAIVAASRRANAARKE